MGQPAAQGTGRRGGGRCCGCEWRPWLWRKGEKYRGFGRQCGGCVHGVSGLAQACHRLPALLSERSVEVCGPRRRRRSPAALAPRVAFSRSPAS